MIKIRKIAYIILYSTQQVDYSLILLQRTVIRFLYWPLLIYGDIVSQRIVPVHLHAKRFLQKLRRNSVIVANEMCAMMRHSGPHKRDHTYCSHIVMMMMMMMTVTRNVRDSVAKRRTASSSKHISHICQRINKDSLTAALHAYN